MNEFASAVSDFQTKNLPSAARRCEQILEKQPQNEAALDLLLTIRLAERNLDAALTIAQRAAALPSPGAVLENNIGITFVQAGRMADAVEHLKRAVVAKPDYINAQLNLTRAYGAAARYEDAIDSMGKLLKLDPAKAPLFNPIVKKWATELRILGNASREFAFLEEALKFFPDDGILALQSAAARFRAGESVDNLRVEIERVVPKLSSSDPRHIAGPAKLVAGRLRSLPESLRFQTPHRALSDALGEMPAAIGRLSPPPIQAARDALAPLYHLHDACIVPPLWFAYQADSIYAEPFVPDVQFYFSERSQLVRSPNLIARADDALLLRVPEREVRIDDACILLGGNPHPAEFYSWFVHFLPRLAVLDACNVKLDRPLLVNEGLASFQKQSLVKLGITEENLRHCPMTSIARCADVLVPALPATLDAFYPYAMEWLRARLAPKAVEHSPSLPGRKVFVSRRNPARRRFLNEEAAFEALAPMGFEKVVVDAMSLDDQIAAFSDATTIVGPMGTCLLDVLFAPTCAQVIEIIPENTYDTSRHIENVSRAIGQSFHTLPAVAAKNTVAEGSHDVDFTVDVPLLKRAVAERL